MIRENRRKRFKFEFDKIDSPEKAYVYGFFVADGHNSIKNNYIRIELQRRDVNILYRIRDIVGSDTKIQFFTRKTFQGKIKQYARLSINSVVLCENLLSLGVVSNKTESVETLYIPQDFFWPFLRGMSDGDGNIYVNSSRASWSLNGHKTLLQKIKQEIEHRTGINVYETDHHRTSYIARIGIEGRKGVSFFLKQLYAQSTIHLIRKKRCFEQNEAIIHKLRFNPKQIQTKTSCYRGVVKRGNKWRASISIKNQTHELGYYVSEVEAAQAYDKAAKLYHKNRAITNFHED